MKIVFINSVCGVGSTGRIVEEMARKEVLAGNQVMIAYGRGEAEVDGVKMYRIGSPMNLLLHGIESRLFDNHGFGSRYATKRFLNILDDYKPDLIHMHNIHGYYINVKMLFDYIKERSITVRWTLHDCWPFTGHCSFAGEEIGCNKWKHGCFACPMKKYYPSSLIIDKSKVNYQKKRQVFSGVKNLVLISPSMWLADLIRESFLKIYPVSVVRNTIDLKSFKLSPSDFRSKYGIEEKFLLLCVGFAWDEWKIADLAKISNSLEKDEVLVIVGMDKKHLKLMNKKTVGIERTDSKEDLAKIYSAADVFINPTYSDNYPTVNLEAEACGTRVVCYDSGGSKETIAREDSAVVKKGDIEALLEQVRFYKREF